jgi:isopentenyl diphosphate isomerase/L-lactate dehydrogenase-like FMN-dependent dehydrogenase
LAAEHGLAGVVLSNHGGRQLDFARSGIEVLVEVVNALKERNLFPNPKFEIFVDGGVRRASDVLKAVALGATAGMRNFLFDLWYSMAKDLLVHSWYWTAIFIRVLGVWTRR